MALHVTLYRHTLEAPKEVKTHLGNLAALAAYAKYIKDDKFYNNVRDAYVSFLNGWMAQARSEAKRKSSINWLGGGTSYSVSSPDCWDSFFAAYSTALEESNPEEKKMWIESILKPFRTK